MTVARERRERIVARLKRYKLRLRPITRDVFIGWVCLISIGFLFLGGGRILVGEDGDGEYALSVWMAVWAALSAGALALLTQALFVLSGRARDWAARLREVAARFQSVGSDILLRERAAQYEAYLWLKRDADEEKCRELEVSLCATDDAVDQAWEGFLVDSGRRVNNVCQEIEESWLCVPEKVDKFRQSIGDSLRKEHGEKKEKSELRRQSYDWRNGVCARLSHEGFHAAGQAALLPSTGAPQRPSPAPPWPRDDALSDEEE